VINEMGRQKDPKRDEAKEIYKVANGEIGSVKSFV
jgi:hypothetical protein